MYDCRRFFIDGEWLIPTGRREAAVINPATEQPVGRILLGTAEDVDVAAQAARKAFATYSQTSREERIALLDIFSHVNNMSIAREEILGPVLTLIPYEDEADAIRGGREGFKEFLETKAAMGYF